MGKNKQPKVPLDELSTSELIYTLLADRVGAVDPKDIFNASPIQGGKHAGKYSCILGGKKLTKNQLGSLHSEALLIEKMQLWKIFRETLSHEADLRMFKLAKNERDMDWGKAILHAVSIFEAIVKSIQNAHVEEAI